MKPFPIAAAIALVLAVPAAAPAQTTPDPSAMDTDTLIADMVSHSDAAKEASTRAADDFNTRNDKVAGCSDLDNAKAEMDLTFADMDEYDNRLKTGTDLSDADRADLQKEAANTRDQMQDMYDTLMDKTIAMCPA